MDFTDYGISQMFLAIRCFSFGALSTGVLNQDLQDLQDLQDFQD
jgi:hypothetical protein